MLIASQCTNCTYKSHQSHLLKALRSLDIVQIFSHVSFWYHHHLPSTIYHMETVLFIFHLEDFCIQLAPKMCYRMTTLSKLVKIYKMFSDCHSHCHVDSHCFVSVNELCMWHACIELTLSNNGFLQVYICMVTHTHTTHINTYRRQIIQQL